MTPIIPEHLWSKLVKTPDGSPSRYKVQMPRGHTHYDVYIDSDGVIVRINDRPIHTGADVGFLVAAIEDIQNY